MGTAGWVCRKACPPEAGEGGGQAELTGQGVLGRGASSANGLGPGAVGAFRGPVMAIQCPRPDWNE